VAPAGGDRGAPRRVRRFHRSRHPGARDRPNAEVLSNRGAALRRLDRIEEALFDYDRALALAPNWVEAWNNRGVALAALNRHGEAIAAYDRALAINPRHLMARFNRGLSRLVTGDLAGGWEDHEARWGGSDTQPARRDFTQAQWMGEPLEGSRLLLHAEQAWET
jgi:tetratricopeptide (TPR) repeat protein